MQTSQVELPDYARGVLAILPSRCIYTNCYCEENVWHLCDVVKRDHPAKLDNCWAVFISNANQSIPLWEQKAGKDESGLVIWDYHVIFLQKTTDGTYVFDLDSRLGFPCTVEEYVTRTIRDDTGLRPQFYRMFRIVPADAFMKTFSSDRRHMRATDGSWIKPPPGYPPILAEGFEHNLHRFIDMSDNHHGMGEVLTVQGFCEQFCNMESLIGVNLN